MKKIILIITTLLCLQIGKSQINTNLIVSGNPPSTLTEWALRKDVLLYQVQRGQGISFSYKIKTEIRLLDGTVIARNDLAKATTYQLGSANVIYYAPEVLQLELMQFTGKYKTTFERTGKLTADNYQLCTRLVNPIDYAPLSNETCKTFYVAAMQLPILMKPAEEEELNYDIAKTTITFRWTPVVPKPQSVVTYKLLVFEVLQNQNPVQAMRSNKPILDKEVRGTTQYIWQPQGIITCPLPCRNDGTEGDRLIKDSTKPKQYVGHVTLIKRTLKPTNNLTIMRDDGTMGDRIILPSDVGKLIIFRDDGTSGDKMHPYDSLNHKLIIFRDDGTSGDRMNPYDSLNHKLIIFRDDGTSGDRILSSDVGKLIIFRDDGTMGDKISNSSDHRGYNTFVWTIQTLDPQGNPIGDGNVNADGVSEPKRFTITNKNKSKVGKQNQP